MRSAPLAEPLTRDGRATRTPTVLGLGHHLPETKVSNLPIAQRLGIDESWIVKRTGIRSRRHAMPEERLSDLAIAAAQAAVKDAGIDPTTLDAVLVATTSADEITPNAAPYVATALGASHANALDIGAACTAWVTALSVGVSMIESGRAETLLVIGADALSRFTDFDDKRTAALFGDGAGAIVLGTRDEGGGVGPFVFGSDAELAEAIIARRTDSMLRMDGHTTFNAAVAALVSSTREACELAGVALDDVDLFVYHQANARITRSVAERLELPAERVADYIADIGNTSAASIPLALAFAREEDRLHPGDTVAGGRRRRRLHLGRDGARVGRPRMSNPRPDNATALVTGASKGIGAAVAIALAEDGWNVGVGYRSDREGAERTVKAIEEAGGRALAVEGDVADANGVADELIGRLESEFGPVLALVNNAGITADGLAIQMEDDDWDRVINTNLTAAFRMTRRAMRPMIKARFGRVINIASVVGPRANAGQANYAAAKAGLIGLTKTVAAEVARRGVTVNAVAPGFIATDMTEDIPDAVLDAVPAKRVGTPEEVAAAVRFLASDGAGYVTGSTLFVDGGMSA